MPGAAREGLKRGWFCRRITPHGGWWNIYPKNAPQPGLLDRCFFRGLNSVKMSGQLVPLMTSRVGYFGAIDIGCWRLVLGSFLHSIIWSLE